MIQEQLGAVLVEVVDLHQANEELAGRLVEVTHLRDESTVWACGGATMARINSNRCMVLERAVEATVKSVQPTGSDLHEHALRLPVRIREETAHGARHGATTALVATHLRL